MNAYLTTAIRYLGNAVKPALSRSGHLCQGGLPQTQRYSDHNDLPEGSTHGSPPWALYRSKSNMRRFLFYTLSTATAFIILHFWLPIAPLSIATTYEKAAPDPSILLDQGSVHPVQQLWRRAEHDFVSCNASQSKSLSEAVAEYRRRYDRSPPPHFDVWYKFAVSRDIHLIDEYDTIHKSLRLFWSVPPQELRARAAWLLEHRGDLSLMGVTIRDGSVLVLGSGQGGYQDIATQEMIEKFSEWLPDMDLVFNVNDEPRVLVPWEDIMRMEDIADNYPRDVQVHLQDFTGTNSTIKSTVAFRDDIQFTRLDQQSAWPQVKYACPIGTPARALINNSMDYAVTYQFQGLEFVTNVDLQSDICQRPSLRNTIGLLASPNALSTTSELVPIFSPSKLSSFADILYPSPYYYAEKVKYDTHTEDEAPWEHRKAQLFWHGATSGGYSSTGQWRSLLRQAVVSKLTLPSLGETVKVLQKSNSSQLWEVMEEDASRASERYDVLFTEIKQCSPQDYVNMVQHFGRHPLTAQSDTWKYKYLLGMDGNGLSGRFPSSLASGSLVMKVAFFHEWWTDRMFPWRDYVPLAETVDEVPELLRYFEKEHEGRQLARIIAENGRQAANGRFRKEDMEVYTFRLLLEYAFTLLYHFHCDWKLTRSIDMQD
jgi:hypothetical protein